MMIQKRVFKMAGMENVLEQKQENSDCDEPARKIIKIENENFKNSDYSESEISEIKRESAKVESSWNKNDIGLYVKNNRTITTRDRRELLSSPYVPDDSYDFRNDAEDVKRVFKKSWLQQYSPWMVYSAMLKGVICLFCVLFPQPVRRGFQGAFIKAPYTKFKDIHRCAEKHMSSEWHRGAQQAAMNR